MSEAYETNKPIEITDRTNGNAPVPHKKKKSCIRRFFGMYADSAKEMKYLLTIVVCGLMAALAIVISSTMSFYIPGTEIKVGLSGLPNRAVDFLYGPVVGCIFGGVMDIVKFFIKPDGAFFPGYTLTAMLGGLIYGTFFYRLHIKKPKDNRISTLIMANIKSLILIFIAEVLVKVLCNMGLNTLWSMMFTGKAFWALLPTRVTKNLIMIPVDTVLHFVLIQMIQTLQRFLFPNERRAITKKK